MIYLVLILSLGLNGFSAWYVYNLLKDRIALVELFRKFQPLIKDYETHLTTLTKMEMYFGEPTIMSLVEHTKQMREAVDNLIDSVEVEEKEVDEQE